MDRYIPPIPAGPAVRPLFMNASQPAPLNSMSFPVGMAYVPMQQWQQTYDLGMGFSRGTIFPDLDLPFEMGRCQS